jgi:PII-like signaling protein
MHIHPKKRLEIVLEAPVLNRMLALLDRLAVTGYTVMPALAGRGQGGSWSRDGLVGEAGRMVVVFCIIDAARVDPVLDAVFAMVERQIGIVSVSDVGVVRPTHF